MQHFSVQKTIVMRADNWKDFQVANVLLRIQNIPDIHLIIVIRGNITQYNILQKYQASNTERLVFQVFFQIEISLFGGYSNDLLEHQNLSE